MFRLNAHRVLRAPIVSSFGPELQGPLRLPFARLPPPEPYDLWLCCRNCVTPFREDALVLTGDGGDDDGSSSSSSSFAQRARKHFLRVASTADDRGAAFDICVAHAHHLGIRSKHDVLDLFARYRRRLRPHGCLCLVGATPLVPGEPLLCRDDQVAADWCGLTGWILQQCSDEELYTMNLMRSRTSNSSVADEEKNKVDAEQNSTAMIAPADCLVLQHVREAATSCGLAHVSFHEFQTEYPVTLRSACGLARAMPSYRRAMSEEATSSSSSFGGRTLVDDPVEFFSDLAELRLAGSDEDKNVMRLRMRHWMWVCDSRPRSRDVLRISRK